MMVTELLKPQPGDRILDLCAAPGGKSSHIAEKLGGKGKVIACDVSSKKLIGLEENKKRLSLDNIETRINDASVYNPKFEKSFDKVLLDAPCSGLGIIRRKPDIKYNRLEGDSKALMAVQKEMLALASHYVKDGGVLVYSTCTIDPVENEEVIEEFLSDNHNFEKDASLDVNEIKLYPNINGTDGFYCCRLKKK
jgi:16S rRNA (cytosine967-C5)-methyltransferase